jgi:hypothetical protein
MLKTTMLNPTDKPIEWAMAGMPGRPPTVYKCPPGKTVEVPKPYVDSGAIAKLAPGLVPAPAKKPEPKPTPKAEAKPEPVAEKPKAAKKTKPKATKKE